MSSSTRSKSCLGRIEAAPGTLVKLRRLTAEPQFALKLKAIFILSQASAAFAGARPTKLRALREQAGGH